jgi:bifunctional non-homologous end joining protein LigD
MLARAGSIPPDGYAFEVKWDGVRALVSRDGGLQVRSRRGSDMAALLPELAGLPNGLVLDGELVALGHDGLPSFPRLRRRVLGGESSIAVTYMIFDLLWIDGENIMSMGYLDRRELLEELELAGPCWDTPGYTCNGDLLRRWTLEQGLEGIVAKPLRSGYRPGKRGWIKVKHPSYCRFRDEREAVGGAYAPP